MSQLTTVNRSQLFAAATAITAVGFLIVATPARAGPMLPLTPPCSQYVFTGNFSLRQANGYQVFFTSTGPATSGPAVAVSDNNVDKMQGGPVNGGIQGRNVDFTIHWTILPNGSKGHYTGVVGDDGFVHGDTTDELSGQRTHWDSINSPLGCSTPVAPPLAPAAKPAVGLPGEVTSLPGNGISSSGPTLEPQAPSAPTAAPPAPKPLQGPTVSAQPGLTGVTFHVTDRSGVASQCTYSSEGFTSASFSLPANGSFDLFVPAIRQFRNRTGTVTCDNGTSASTSVFF
jgi:hypothetical protein